MKMRQDVWIKKHFPIMTVSSFFIGVAYAILYFTVGWRIYDKTH